ncbi:MAG: hypothetical protein ACFFG0_24010 [Candidatus Thorarchaeota archaeon]
MVNQNNCVVSEVLYRLNVGSEIDLEILRRAFDTILIDNESKARDAQLGSLLTGLMAKGPTVDEVVTLLESSFSLDGFSPYERKKIQLPNKEKLISAIGSGKKGHKTMNISTPALLIAASMGVYTAKPVSSSTSSLSGSADLLRSVGVNIDLPNEDMEEVIRKTRFGAFCIESLIPKFDKVYGGKFYVPHALSFALAALVSPIKFDSLIYGLAHPDVETSIQVLQRFGIHDAMVASTTHDNIHYLDEMGVYGTTKLVGMKGGDIGKIIYFRPTEELGLPRYTPEQIAQADSLGQNIKYCIDVLKGKGEEPREDIICINAGTILYLAERAEDFKEGYYKAKEAVKTGQPLEKLIEVTEISGGDKRMVEDYLK